MCAVSLISQFGGLHVSLVGGRRSVKRIATAQIRCNGRVASLQLVGDPCHAAMAVANRVSCISPFDGLHVSLVDGWRLVAWSFAGRCPASPLSVSQPRKCVATGVSLLFIWLRPVSCYHGCGRPRIVHFSIQRIARFAGCWPVAACWPVVFLAHRVSCISPIGDLHVSPVIGFPLLSS